VYKKNEKLPQTACSVTVCMYSSSEPVTWIRFAQFVIIGVHKERYAKINYTSTLETTKWCSHKHDFSPFL